MKKHKPSGRSKAQFNLKAASGAGFSFEDKITAFLFCEMLAGKSSLGGKWGVVERIERQAGDWEPFGDLLLTAHNIDGKSAKCGCSVKSNKQITTNGCNTELRDGCWSVIAKPCFNQSVDALGIFCAVLSSQASPVLNQLCKQAVEEERPRRLDEKIKELKHRKIYDSFRHPTNTGDSGLSWHILSRLIPREFDFEDATSRNEEAAVTLCREMLAPSDASNERPRDLWKALLNIAQGLRDTGGSVTRERLTSMLRRHFRLRDDPSDVAVWGSIRSITQEWIGQIETTLPGGLVLPRKVEMDELRKNLTNNRAFHVIGESGSGKSALLKGLAIEYAASGAEIVWIKADQYGKLINLDADIIGVLRRTRQSSALIVFDAIEACGDDILNSIGKTVVALSSDEISPWKAILVCQTPEWPRVSRRLVGTIVGHDALTKNYECGDLSSDDKALVYEVSPSVRRLASQPRLARLLSTPKMLDLLLRGQLSESRTMASEADFVDWWWEGQVTGGRLIAAEERIARAVAIHMASDLTSEVSPDIAVGPTESLENLIKKRVLRRTRDGRIRFDHDLLADWSRVMHLRSLGDGALDFMRANTKQPPWLRAIRLFSQHLLERRPDLDRWQSVVAACNKCAHEEKEPSAVDLQVLDAWLEGIAYCTDSLQILNSVKGDLFAQKGWLLRRFIRRLLHSGTVPDPIIQQRFQQIDVGTAEAAAMRYRLPQAILWHTIIEFLISNPEQATDYLPEELAEIGAMWARLEEYLNLTWSALASLVLLNGEKELRCEVAGEYRGDRGSQSLGRDKSRVSIYSAALRAASQLPDRAMKLALKAAGRMPWEEGDISEMANDEWRGVWHDHSFFGHDGTHVKNPVESWPQGPARQVSRDMFSAWFDGNAALALYRLRPNAACEATLALLIDWPKSEIMRGRHVTGADRHGFRYEADNMYPAFWAKGPFLLFLRQDWRSALELVIQLVNFATDRYADNWPYEPGVAEISFTLPEGPVHWKGNQQVYAWSRYHMNTPQVVTCALMALEKWFDEQIAANIAIEDAVKMLYRKGRSLAFAGVMISIGKRHPEKFIGELKSLLFHREIFMYDVQATTQCVDDGYWPSDGKLMNKLRSEWNQLPGRKTMLKDACREWLVTKPEWPQVLGEVSTEWRKQAQELAEGSEAKIILLRWAADFDRSLYKEVTLPDGRKGWQCERPPELNDAAGEELIRQRHALLSLPFQCSKLLGERPRLNEDQLEGIWQQLKNWAPFEQASSGAKEDVKFIDHRHARAGLLAILLCLGQEWLQKNPSIRKEIETEIHKLFIDPPESVAFTEEDIHDDYEGFMARCVIQCWASAPQSPEWRSAAGGFVTAYRYRTVQHLFDEAFRLRDKLGDGYRDLEALAISFAVARHETHTLLFRGDRHKVARDAVREWRAQWLPLFSKGNGPKWEADWSTVEKLDKFSPNTDTSYSKEHPRYEWHRRAYGLDMGVVFAAFGHFPALAVARNDAERAHWFNVCNQMLGAFCRTLPPSDNEDDVWKYEVWPDDKKVFNIVARRLYECVKEERIMLWQPILNLPPAAHHHITDFLNSVWLASLITEPPRIPELIQIWGEMAEFLVTSKKWTSSQTREIQDVWSTLLLYGTPFSSKGDEMYIPLVQKLRHIYKWYIKSLVRDSDEQSTFAAFLISKAGECLLVDVLVWLGRSWGKASSYFWDTAVERGYFESLLGHAWRAYYPEIRNNPDAFSAFKILTMNLAAHHSAVAIEIQQQIGTDIK